MTKIFWMASTALVAAALVANPAIAGRSKADQRDQEIQDLKARLDKLEQEDAAAKQAAEDERIQNGARLAKVEATQDAVQWTFNDGRPLVRSGDGRFELAIRGMFQADVAAFQQDNSNMGIAYGCAAGTSTLCDLGSGAVMRRVRFGVEGKFFKDFIYELRFDFGGTDLEGSGIVNIARVGYVGIPGLRIQAGIIQPVFTMYDATSSSDLTTMERPQVVTMLVGNFGGDNDRRGVEVTYQQENLLYQGDNFVVSTAFTGDRTAANGSSHTGGPDDEKTQLLGRIAYRLWSDGVSNVQVGASGSMIESLQGQAPGGARNLNLQERPEIRVTGERFISTGNIALDTSSPANAFGFEAGMNWQNIYLAGEWYQMNLNRPAGAGVVDPTFTGWYAEGEWIITGEAKRYAAAATNNGYAVFRGPSVTSPWSLGGGTGAWSVHARYSDMDLNDNVGTGVATANNFRGGEETNTILGVTWYMNANLKLQAEYNMVDISRLSATGTSLDASFDVIQGRMQFAF